MKKRKLVVDLAYDFTLFGIISHASEHKLAWEINQKLKIQLIKSDDIKINFLNNKNLVISNFHFEKEESILRLLKNKAVDIPVGNHIYLMPELKQFDYLVIIHGFEQTFKPENVISNLNAIGVIQYAVELEIDKLKSKENLVF